MSASLQAGDRLGSYEIVRPLASGGMAEVFVARSAVGRPVALKRILADFASDENFVQLFLREARIAIGLVHPNIAQVLDVGEADGSYFLVMELVEGISLLTLERAARVRGERLPLPVVVWIIERTARALHHAHTRVDEQGVPLCIVHRDVSPQNILLDSSGEVKLVDFGVARAANAAQLTRPGVTRGKYLYFSPEQIGMQPLDGRSDLYSLGVVFYELLLGARPYDGELVDVLRAISRGSFVAPCERDPTLPAELGDLCQRTMRTKPEARWAGGEELALALERWAHARAPEVDDAVIRGTLAHYAPQQLEEALGRPVASAPRPPELEPWIRRSGEAVDLPASLAPTTTTSTQPTTAAIGIARVERTLRAALLPLLVLGIAAGGFGLFWLLKPSRSARFVGRRPTSADPARLGAPPKPTWPSEESPPPAPAAPVLVEPSLETRLGLPARPADGSARESRKTQAKIIRLTFALADARLDLSNTRRFEMPVSDGERTVTMDGEVTLAGDRVPTRKLLLLSREEAGDLPPRFVRPPGFTLPAMARSFRLLLFNPNSFLTRRWVFPEGHFEIGLGKDAPPHRVGPLQIIDPWASRLPYLRIDWNVRYRIRAHLEPVVPDRPLFTFVWIGTPIDLMQWGNRTRAGFTGDDLSGLVREHEALETDGLGAVWLALAAGPETFATLDDTTRLIVEVKTLGSSRLFARPARPRRRPTRPPGRRAKGPR